MITRLTKIQLVIFAIVTLLGGAFVGGRYAKVDRIFVDRSFSVTAQLQNSGGIFEDAQVTYRGVAVGQVGKMTFKGGGVEARLDIEDSAPRIPADVLAVVANKSAVGEQFMDLQPRSSSAPYLKAGSTISSANTRIPISTTKLLLDIDHLTKSIDNDSLKTLVDELGAAFQGTGPDLARIIDTSTAFIETANDNIGVTRALIQDSNVVLKTQVDKGSQIATFSKNLALLSDTLVSSDKDIRRLVDVGPESARVVRQVIDENADNLSVLINNLITVNRPAFENTQAVRALFILYPYLVEGSPSTLIHNDADDAWDAAFGMVMTSEPHVCNDGYGDRDPPQAVGAEFEMFDTTVDCDDDSLVHRNPSKTTINRAAAAGYDSANATTTPTDAESSDAFGKDSWKWLLLGPATSN